MKAIDALAVILVIVGAVNWGLVGLARFNLVAALFGDGGIAAVIYTLVGISGVYLAGRWATVRRPAFATA